MKKFLVLVLTFVIFALALCGCKKPQGENLTSQITTQSSPTVSNDNSSVESVENSSLQSVTSATQSQSTTTTSNTDTVLQGTSSEDVISYAPPPSEKLILNKDFLDIVGKTTYKELKAKYGEPVDVFCDELNSAVYKFPGTDIWYGFSDLDWGKKLDDPTIWPDVPTDENGKWIFEKAPKPNKKAKCNAIYYAKVSDLFSNMKEPVDIVDMEEYGGLMFNGNTTGDGGKYIAMYMYNQVYIVLECDKNNAVWPENSVQMIKLYSDISADEEN